jgi:hypothetical protein
MADDGPGKPVPRKQHAKDGGRRKGINEHELPESINGGTGAPYMCGDLGRTAACGCVFVREFRAHPASVSRSGCRLAGDRFCTMPARPTARPTIVRAAAGVHRPYSAGQR